MTAAQTKARTRPEQPPARQMNGTHASPAAAQYIGLPASALRSWTRRQAGPAPLAHRLRPETPRSASLPFVGLVEAHMLRGFRELGLSAQGRDVTPLEFLIDRSLSQVSLPAALHEAGLIARTLAEVYGDQAAVAAATTTRCGLCHDGESNTLAPR